LKPPKELRNGFKDPKRLAAIHNLPCSLCFFLRTEQTSKTIAHHQIGLGLGKKASDRLAMSLCEFHHTKGQDAIHHIGRVAWEEKFDITEGDLILLTNKMLEKCSDL
jgi:hypothetical protein